MQENSSTTQALPKICLAASGGGHVRQILDLEPFWTAYPHFFVTEDTALGRSIAQKDVVDFVDHVALGQARLGAPFRMAFAALRNCWQSLRIVLRHRPDIVITTGAGAMIFTVLWARLLGAHIVLIDSFARFDKPSAFARIAGPFAHVRVAQSAASGAVWQTPHVFDPFRILDTPRPAKEPLLFATVGATLKFDRLVGLVDNAVKAGLVPERVIVQVGEGGRQPDGLECHETLPFEEVKAILDKADIVVCHGGTGSLITALRAGCRVIAVPRRFDRGEHYDDHQSEITEAFSGRGLLAIADTDEEFAAALAMVRGREPRCATTDPQALIAFLREQIGSGVR
ncbi:hypothetical protein LWE61_18535 [Sphingobium sufflavum]|uniref:beta-1,4-glucuronosyltransferase WelK n=1 Tax=Sphingobium sufflavum TaxID=1129547 RepID=UPI001F2D4880|nr:glycosyltransferase [Sphingobium sufflavum]MCE7798533.1 hypothetical protein [Sphingobium sufflavum]